MSAHPDRRDACSGNDGLVLDVRGNAIVTGITSSVNFPTTAGAFDRTYAGGINGFVAKLSPDGRSLLASTYIGGSAAEETSGIDIDPNGRIYLSGTTASRDYPVTPDALQASFGGGEADVMVSVLTPDLSSLLWSTYYGGGGVGGYAERGRCLTLDNRGRIVVSGDTNSSDFPCTPGALQTSRAGDSDAFVLRIVSALVPIQGDADGDRHVDAVDLLRLAKAWLTVTGDAGYDASCDFDRNAHIGVIDLLMLADNWRI